jgi:transcriptional regulator with GAF, ATPase, and Fis domain
MLTGVGSEALAVAAMKAGARDYIVKDIENNFLSLVPAIIDRIGKELALERELVVAECERSRLEARNRYLSSSLRKQTNANIPIGQHPAFKRVLNVIEQVAPTDATVIITGETGTGKEMAAQLIHDMSAREDKPFITVNCAALPAQLVESELFGHEKGAFTDAIRSRAGRFEAAHGGTLFLDEIGELPLEVQPRLLRALQESKFERVGSNETQSVDVRIISATNQDLPARIADKTFREDLYYRLNVIPVHILPLRERGSDIELLFMHFIRHVSDRHHISAPDTSAAVLASIRDYAWPGNIRELRNYVERGVVTQKWDTLIAKQHSRQPGIAGDAFNSPTPTLDELDRNHIIAILQRTKGVIAGDGGAAQILGIKANTLRSRMKRLGIEKPGFSL